MVDENDATVDEFRRIAQGHTSLDMMTPDVT